MQRQHRKYGTWFFWKLGYHENKFVIRSDQEPPMRAVGEKLANESHEAQTIMAHSLVESVRTWLRRDRHIRASLLGKLAELESL